MPFKRSPYDFKSPTYLARTGHMPEEMASRIGLPRTRTPQAVKFDAWVVGLLGQLSASTDFTLATLERIFPLPYVHVVPSRHATLIFSAYSCALAERHQHPPPATFDEMNEYAQGGDYWTENLVRDKLFLYKIVSPFRRAYGFPPRHGPKRPTAYPLPPETARLLQLHSTPGLVIANVGAKLRREGYISALTYVRGLRRASEKIGSILRVGRGYEMIPTIVARYLTLATGLGKPATPARQLTRPTASPSPPVFCYNCGAQIQPGQNFCGQCGTRARAS